MIRRYLKFLKSLFILSALVMFAALLLAPVYGWIRPWTEAETAMRGQGITGALFMIGGSWKGQYASDARGASWSTRQSRTFIAVPDSFRTGELFGYVEARKSGVAEAQSEVV